jgi:hypothetical protein
MPASARMVPGSYDIYFATMATAAAALIGLLFVAISQRDDTIFGRLADLAYVLFATLLVSLQRAWSLLRGTHLRKAADAGGAADRPGEQGATG